MPREIKWLCQCLTATKKQKQGLDPGKQTHELALHAKLTLNDSIWGRKGRILMKRTSTRCNWESLEGSGGVPKPCSMM